MALISKKVRGLIRDRLASAAGLNHWMSYLADGSGVTDVPVINWDPEAGQVFESNISFEDAAETSEPTTPCVFIFCTGIENTRGTKFSSFTGQVTAQVDVVFESGENAPPVALENMADLVEEALVRCLNGTDWNEVQGGSNIGYNGQIATERSAATPNEPSSNWRQVVTVTITFEVRL